MVCLRSVVSPKPFRLDANSKFGVLAAMIPGLVSVPPNTVPQDDIDAATETFEKLFKSLAQQLGTEDVLPRFQAAVGAAAEEVKALPVETTEPERVDILVRHLRGRFNETGLASQLEEALEAAVSTKSWLSMIGGWALGGLKRALPLGTTSGIHQLLPFVSLLGMVGALPIGTRDDETLPPAVTDAVGSGFGRKVNDWMKMYGESVIIIGGSFDLIMGPAVIIFLRSVPWTPEMEYFYSIMFPFGLHRLLMPPPAPPPPIPIRAKKSRRG
eukprot:Blabericola_migrator_1__3128@NODE_1912_length_3574_cov_23_574565_g197_i1_p1_GENE_NODE_1912_length_3574_cov_23_574565_g197_i1NODE_1912_length_3574_cov_23_574565_g197_i1_p1_ORF_typecomplete_len270_score45_96_NODE_1912_length_3574_cov_23_574565_g197_i18491658